MINLIHFVSVLTTITIVIAVFVPYVNIRGELIRCGSFLEGLPCAGRYNSKALSTHTVQHQQYVALSL